MTTTTTTIACPNWCQSKPHDDPAGGFDGPHTWPAVPAQDGFNDDKDDKDDNYNSSALVSVDLPEPGMDDEGAVIYLTAGSLTLTLKQGRAVALALLTVADWAEGHEVTA
jgi:hypothetical protein